MKVLVCGGRDYKDEAKVHRILDELHSLHRITVIVEGGAGGADSFGASWALKHGIPHRTYFADWRRYGLRAGPVRNREMLMTEKPKLVVAFPGGTGTADMVKRATKAGVEGSGQFRIHTPLIDLTKADIIRRGTELGVDYGMTISCYDPDADGLPCGGCDACLLRQRGFSDAGLVDPLPYPP